MDKFIDLTGQRFGRLIIIKRLSNNKYRSAMWECKCDCGKTIKVTTSHLKSGHTKSCGCLSKERISKLMYKHGLSKNPDFFRLMNIRKGMKNRCYNSHNDRYLDYGGRGIKVCDEWMDKENGTLNFYNWAINHGYKEGLTIDRIDVNGNYEPDNCRWVSIKKQNNNKRNNHYIIYDGKRYTIKELSDILDINYNRLRTRIKRKYPDELWFIKERITPTIKEYYKNRGE